MANKTHLGIGATIALLVAAYFGIDLNQPTAPSEQHPSQDIRTETKQLEQVQTEQRAELQNKKDQDQQTQHQYQQNSSQNRHGSQVIQQSFQRKLSNVQVQSAGTVKAVLRDDNEGSRHQKFILKLDNGLTVLVAHNIDLAPRIENIKKGDTVEFFGEYEYSHEGGVIHWTHHDPQKHHEDGWLKHNGRTYQ